MVGKKKISQTDVAINKTILFIILAVLAVLTVVGYGINIIVGAIFMIFFVMVFNVFVDIPALKAWINEVINEHDW